MSEYGIAPFYDLLLYPFLRKIRKTTANIVLSYKPESIIDLCCGTGNQLKLLKRHGINGTGVDLSEDMLKVAAKGKYKVNCYKQDAAKTEFDAGSFDMALIQLALHEKTIETSYNILNEMHRLLKKGGHGVITDFEFNEKTGSTAKKIISSVEKFAGSDHYNNFQQYTNHGGLKRLIKESKFSIVNKIPYGNNSISIITISKIDI